MPVIGGDNPNVWIEGLRDLDSPGWGDFGEPSFPITGLTTVSGSFTLDAVLLRSASATFTLDAILKKTASASFTLNANIVRTTSASFTLDTVIKKTASATFTLDAVLKRTQSATFTLDAAISAGGFSGTFTLDAILRRSQSASFTLDAVIKATISRTYTLDSVLKRTQTGSFTLNAFVGLYFRLNAVFFKRTTTHFSLDAQLFKRTTRTFTLNATLVSHIASFTLNAWIRGRQTSTFTLDATIVPTPVPPTERTKAFIKVNNVDYAHDIIYADAEFTAQVNGQPGTCRFRVRDVHHIYTFTSGDEVRIWIGDTLVWGGFVTKAQPGYAFKVDNTQNPTLTERIWVIEGVDYNILFQRRYVIDVNDPTASLPIYPIGTDDDVLVRDLVQDFLILSGDNLDFSGIQHVGTANPDLKFNIANPGDSWGQAMSIIAKATGAIFYIDPNRTVYYVDDDALETALVLSDSPANTSTTTDNFNRTVAVGWGTGPFGTWSLSASSASVSPGEAQITSFVSFTAEVPIPAAVLAAEDWVGHVIFKWPSSLSDTNINFEMDWAETDFNWDIYAIVLKNGDFQLGWSNPDTGDFADASAGTPTANSQWEIEISWTQSTGTLRGRAWPTAGARPDYLVTLTGVDILPSDLDKIWLNATSNNGGIPFNARLWKVNEVSLGAGGAATAVGYRDMEIVNNGTGLVNDMMVWGAGTGSINGQVTFARVEDTTSITDHGRWQKGEFRTDLYRQTSVNLRASSFVYGSPQNLRGGKDDAISILCTVFEPGFTVGQKVRFISTIFGFDDIIPIRRMRLTFPTPTDPQFELTLSHEVDDPWSTAEFYWPPINFDFPPIVIVEPPVVLPPVGQNCTPQVCGITDDFERTVSSGSWGTATCLVDWGSSPIVIGTTSISVNGSAGLITLTARSGTQVSRSMVLGGSGTPRQAPFDAAAVHTFRFQLPTWDSSAELVIPFTLCDSPGVSGSIIFAGHIDSGISWVSTVGTPIPTSFWNAHSTYTVTVFRVGGSTRMTITDGASSYSIDTGSDPTVAEVGIGFRAGSASSLPHTLRVLEIDDPEITRCTLNVFDDFQRSVTNDWGTASSGPNWTFISGHQAALSVDFIGEMTLDNNDGVTVYADVAPPYNTDFEAVALFRSWPLNAQFQMGVVGAVTFHLDPDSDGHISIVTNTEDNATAFTFVNDEDYYVKMSHQWGVASKLKIWPISGTEPDWMVTATTTTVLGTTEQWFMAGATAGGVGPHTFFISFLDFSYIGKPCYVGDTGPVYGESAPLKGEYCEMAEMVSSSVYRVSVAFVAGTARVFLNGLIQRPGGLLDYTEDPANGEIVFTGPEFPEATDNVYVCYEANGALP